MTDWKRLGKKLLFPPFWVIVMLSGISAAALAAVFLLGFDEHPVGYAVYALSAYAVTTLSLFCVFSLPKYYRMVKERVCETAFAKRYISDTGFKARVSLDISVTVNLLYVAVNILSAIIYRSAWFYVMGSYYTILSAMRILLLRAVRKRSASENIMSELKSSRLCAVMLLAVNIALSGAVLMIMYRGRGADYPGILIYVMAAYTFYITVTAIINFFRYQKYKSPVLTLTKAVSLTAALVSMLSLETAMLTQFGGETSESFRRTMIAATGGGISVIIVVVAVFIIVKNTGELKRLRAFQGE